MNEREILQDILDFEEMQNGCILILKRNGQRLLVKSASERFKEMCYEMMGKTLNIPKKVSKRKKISWSDEEIQYLKENVELEMGILSEKLKKSPYQINYMKGKLNLIDKKSWSSEEIAYLRDNLEKNNTILAEELKRTIFSIKSKKHVIRNKNLDI